MAFKYLLIDSSQRMRIHLTLQRHQVRYESLFDGFPEESLLDIAPLLIDVSKDSDVSKNMFFELTRIGKIKPCLSYIRSTMPIEDLASHLREFHLVQMSDGRIMLLRWYDTRILPIWFDAMNGAQKKFFSKGIKSWSYFDRFGERKNIPIADSEELDHESIMTPLELDKRQSEKLISANEPDLIIAAIRRIIPSEISKVPYSVLYPFVSAQLMAAHEYGLEDMQDLRQYVFLALHSSGKFVDHPVFKQRLSVDAPILEQAFSTWLSGAPQRIWTDYEPLWG